MTPDREAQRDVSVSLLELLCGIAPSQRWFNAGRTTLTPMPRGFHAGLPKRHEFVISTQLCTNLERMPIENANVESSEEESPYQPVARLIFTDQNALSPGRQAFMDDSLLFCPAHSLVAHRPL